MALKNLYKSEVVFFRVDAKNMQKVWRRAAPLRTFRYLRAKPWFPALHSSKSYILHYCERNFLFKGFSSYSDRSTRKISNRIERSDLLVYAIVFSAYFVPFWVVIAKLSWPPVCFEIFQSSFFDFRLWLFFPYYYLWHIIFCSAVRLWLVSNKLKICLNTVNGLFTHSLKLGVVSVPKIGI